MPPDEPTNDAPETPPEPPPPTEQTAAERTETAISMLETLEKESLAPPPPPPPDSESEPDGGEEEAPSTDAPEASEDEPTTEPDTPLNKDRESEPPPFTIDDSSLSALEQIARQTHQRRTQDTDQPQQTDQLSHARALAELEHRERQQREYMAELEARERLLRTDPLAYAEKYGMDKRELAERVTTAALKPDEHRALNEVEALRARVEAQEQALRQRDEQARQHAQAQAAQQAQDRALNALVEIAENGQEYPNASKIPKVDRGAELLMFARDQRARGSQVADNVILRQFEAYLAHRAKWYAATAQSGSTETTPEDSGGKQDKKTGSRKKPRTITNAHASESASRTPLSEEERTADAVRALEEAFARE